MSEYAYKVTLTNEDCLSKRLVAFHDERFLRYGQAEDEARRHMTSQTCPRCKQNHEPDSYVATEVERGEPNKWGGYSYRDVKPGIGLGQLELVF